MKAIFFILGIWILAGNANAQFTSASLQASGLTCSMCSKAVKNALEKVSFVARVQVDIKNQQYNLIFKDSADVDFDDLGQAVEEAGFSIAALSAKVSVYNVVLEKDKHLQIGNKNFHFLNGSGQQLSGLITLKMVDKGFLTAKEFRKYSAASKMKCLQTGTTEACCTKETSEASARIYHVII
jgi:copper chaperone CopZ